MIFKVLCGMHHLLQIKSITFLVRFFFLLDWVSNIGFTAINNYLPICGFLYIQLHSCSKFRLPRIQTYQYELMDNMMIINNIVLYTENLPNEQISGSLKEMINKYIRRYVNLLDCSNYFTIYMYIKMSCWAAW